MATSISMASNALVLIGDDPINALSDSEAASNLYDEVYEGFLSEHPWSFALKEQWLSRLTATPDPQTGYRYAFQVPTDLIRMWAALNIRDYRVVGDLIYANANELLARYVYRVDETSLPAHAVRAIQYKLASEFSVSVAEDEQKMQIFESKYIDALGRAMSVDSQQHPFVGIQNNPIRLR